uniref:DCD domain-containing protein n=1 Tax=Fagus sylvatica TaxID=28930 RepID=A0A2N9IPQ9_FAGSY
MHSFWQLGDELRGQSKVSEDHKWLMAASKLAEQTRTKGERMNNLDLSKGPAEMRTREKFGFQEDNKFESLNFNMLNLDSKLTESVSKSSFRNGIYNMNAVYQKNNANLVGNLMGTKYSSNINHISKASNDNNSNNNTTNNNNENPNITTMQLTKGLPPRYRDSVRAITPGLPLFLYNYTTHQLHGIFEAVSFGGSNIDPTAWEDKKCKGESRFPAQVRIRVRKICKALEEDAFRPVLHHYDGPKFRLELSVPETLDLLDLCEQAGSAA